MKLGVLTSSRADFGIYHPLLNELVRDKFFEVEIIAFGTHLEEEYGKTIDEIYSLGFVVKHQIRTLPSGDSALNISLALGETIIKFSDFWSKNNFDLVFALGDRYEMFAAVSAGTPFNISVAHIHAGETTLGAIDNIYRHSISLMSKYLFVSTPAYKKRATELVQREDNIYNVGALSIDTLTTIDFYSKEQFLALYKIDLGRPTILTTFHPETVLPEKTHEHINEILQAIEVLKNSYQIVITMPNADTAGLIIRESLKNYCSLNPEIKLVESFGMRGYLSCMKHCELMLGNTSSGFVEASFFSKYVINLGNRQDGRLVTPNIKNCLIKKAAILQAVDDYWGYQSFSSSNIYGDGTSAKKITAILKSEFS